MNVLKPLTLLSLSLLLFTAGCDRDPLSQRGKVYLPAQTAGTATAPQVIPAAGAGDAALLKVAQPASGSVAAEEVSWEDLIHPDWRADPKLVELYQAGEIGDDDPRVIETRERLADPVQPGNPALDGKRIRLSGFVVPLEMGEKVVTEFLLVPYQGACIHVPPPPTNQTVLVKTGEKGAAIRKLFDTVWVTGTLTIENNESAMADSGYTLHAEKVEPYE